MQFLQKKYNSLKKGSPAPLLLLHQDHMKGLQNYTNRPQQNLHVGHNNQWGQNFWEGSYKKAKLLSLIGFLKSDISWKKGDPMLTSVSSHQFKKCKQVFSLIAWTKFSQIASNTFTSDFHSSKATLWFKHCKKLFLKYYFDSSGYDLRSEEAWALLDIFAELEQS